MKFNFISLLSIVIAIAHAQKDDSKKINESNDSENKIDSSVGAATPQANMAAILPKSCFIGDTIIIDQRLHCYNRNGKFYSIYHEFPDCYTDYVCFIPAEDSIATNIDVPDYKESETPFCIIIEGNRYCSADISNINTCNFNNKEYDFETCVQKTNKIFSTFNYTIDKSTLTHLTRITKQPITTTTTVIIEKITKIINPTGIPLPSPSPITTCKIGAGEVTHLRIECEKRYGAFYKKFHPFPECYSDFLCLLPPENTKEISSSCINILGVQLCKSDITNVKYCNPDSETYDFEACVKEAEKLFGNLNYLTNPPVRPYETINVEPIPTTTDEFTSIDIPTETPLIEECLIGAGEVTHLRFECENRYGAFYKKFHPFPECYSDFLCLLPPENTKEISSSCINILGVQLCKSDITNVKYCSPDSETYDFEACVKEAEKLFGNLNYLTNPPVRPYETINVEPIPTTTDEFTPIDIPTETPLVEECLIGAGEVTHLRFECENRYGKFYKKFHPFPECYSDFVCFLIPDEEEEINSSCIFISNQQYCKTDITNLTYCDPESKNYDFKACVEETEKLFGDFKYKTNAPSPTPFRTVPTVKPTLTITESISIETPTPVGECLVGEGEVTHLRFECENRYGKFYKKFHSYPECYSDYVCLLGPEKTEEISSSCIYISNHQYCKSDITNVKYCSPDSEDYDFKACMEEAKTLFGDLVYKTDPPLPTPFRIIPPVITTTSSSSTITNVVTANAIATTTTTTEISFLSLKPLPTPMTLRTCLLGEGDTMLHKINCNSMNGKFYSKFHPAPECYSDFVCFISNDEVSTNNNDCIIIDGSVYCSADISSINYCRKNSIDYDFNKCINEAKTLFPNFANSYTGDVISPPKITIPIIKTETEILTIPNTKVVTTITKTETSVIDVTNPTSIPPIELPTPSMPVRPCLPGEGDSILYYQDCSIMNGRFYSRQRPAPECFPDFVCFIPYDEKSHTIDTDCVSINGSLYCSSEISTFSNCKKNSNSYDFKKCIQEVSALFPNFIYEDVSAIVSPPEVTIPITAEVTTIPKIETSVIDVTNSTSIPPIELPTPSMPVRPCLPGEGDSILYYQDCSIMNGRFYSRQRPAPECFPDFVCFIPYDEKSHTIDTDCVSINGSLYCSSEISTFSNCKKNSNSYDFKKCIQEVSALFPNFVYEDVSATPIPWKSQ